MKHIVIYTDGACRGNPGPGGWGVILQYNHQEKTLSGAEPHTTNNRMELMAAIKALMALHETCQIDLFTDSQYVQKGISQWLPQWKAAGWKKSDKKQIKNLDLWQLLDNETTRHHIKWHWIKAHNGHHENEMVDKLANQAIDLLLKKKELNMSLRQIMLDTETTGLHVDAGHRIIEIGAIEMIDRKLTGKELHYYINPEREIDAGAMTVHGIKNEFLLDKPIFKHIAAQVIDFIRDAELIIHNAPFDVGFLDRELQLSNQGWEPLTNYCRITDTFAMAKSLHIGQRNNLDALCKRYNVDLSKRNFHGALLDAYLLAQVYLAMTGGQGDFFDSLIQQPTSQSSVVKRLNCNSKTFELPLLKATEEELKIHENYLKTILQKEEYEW